MSARDELERLSKDDLIDIILQLQKKIIELENELKKYKNSNTPPSANKHLKPNTKGKKSKRGRKRGAPKGHKGTTRRQTVDRHEVIDADTCPRCGSDNLDDEKVFTRVVEEIPEPVLPETVKNEVHKKVCLDCGHHFIPEHNQVPLKGKFGINVMILVVFIKFLLRGVLRKAAKFLRTGFGLKLTPASVGAMVGRVAEAACREYNELKERIRNAEIVYVDETSFSVLGKNQWVWIFRTECDILLVVRPSRGSPVLKEILGTDYQGKVVCDCWRAYDFFRILQRCWAHLLRKAEELKETVLGRHVYEKLKTMFKAIKRFNRTNPTSKGRAEKYETMTKELKAIIKYYSRYEELKGIITYIGNNIGNWFTCIKYEGIEPTNNFAEQALRETVIVRKIIGAFRSENGKQNYETLASLLSSWQLNNFDIKEKLRSTLIKNLCFC